MQSVGRPPSDPHRDVRRAARRLSFLLLAASIILVGVQVTRVVGSDRSARATQRVLTDRFPSSLPVVHTASAALPPTVKEGAAVARLEIPSIELDLVVVEGVGEKSMAKGPGHYPGSAFPGQDGVIAIAAHRNGWGSPFLDLDRVRRGDVVTLIDQSGTHRYRITGSAVVNPTDAWVLRGDPSSSARARLALTTCTPKFTSRQRLVVWGDLLPPDSVTSVAVRVSW